MGSTRPSNIGAQFIVDPVLYKIRSPPGVSQQLDAKTVSAKVTTLR